MNKKLIVPVLLISLLAPFSAHAITAAAAAGAGVGGAAAAGLIIGLIVHHEHKKHDPEGYCQRHPHRSSCKERAGKVQTYKKHGRRSEVRHEENR